MKPYNNLPYDEKDVSERNHNISVFLHERFTTCDWKWTRYWSIMALRYPYGKNLESRNGLDTTACWGIASTPRSLRSWCVKEAEEPTSQILQLLRRIMIRERSWIDLFSKEMENPFRILPDLRIKSCIFLKKRTPAKSRLLQYFSRKVFRTVFQRGYNLSRLCDEFSSFRTPFHSQFSIAVIIVISGLTYKRGERLKLLCMDPFASFVCLFKQKNIWPQNCDKN